MDIWHAQATEIFGPNADRLANDSVFRPQRKPMVVFWGIPLIWLIGALAPILLRIVPKAAPWILAAVPATIFGFLLAGLNSDPLLVTVEWYSVLGASLDFRIDGLSRLMALLVTGIGAFILLYANGYLAGHKDLGRFLVALTGFMGSMLGLVLADNLILLFVFWELTSITSYFLIGFYHESIESRKKALQALIITGLGGLALLAGLVLLGFGTEQWTLSGLMADGVDFRGHPFYTASLILILLGAFTKSAQFPFHFWLPNAMAAPTPVSAYLHSATMVKAGVFLLAALAPVLGGTAQWEIILVSIGGITFLLGAIRGLFQTDLKAILAYTTISVLGLLVLLLGLDFEMAAQSAVLFLLGHALYKGALFMVAGNLDHETGTRDVTRLHGLRRLMPMTALAAGLAALSKAGFPPLFGFVGKEYVYKAGVAIGDLAPFFLGCAILGNALLFALAFKVGVHPFWSKGEADTPKRPHEGPFFLWVGPLVLAVTGLALGLFPSILERPLVEPAVESVLNQSVELKLALWHGFNLPLLLSGVTLLIGFTLYRFRAIFWRSNSWGLPRIVEANDVYQRILNGVISFSKWQTRVLQNGKLRIYLFTILGAVSVLVAWKLRSIAELDVEPLNIGAPIHIIALLLLMTGATVLVLMTNVKTNALLGFGIVGFGIALLFAYFGAPDLAITQIVVETLTLLLLFLVLSRLPEMRRISSKRTLWFDAGFSAVVGLLVFALVLKADLVQLAPAISAQLGDWSYPLAKGKNVVNVILVDFRALDTFGEVIVIVIAALGVGILMRQGRKGE
ncbi:MAG: hydrogen gas-evolving membrane-bound hydrogenase subunit E [Verrucomicrobiota bacterium]